MKEWGNRIRRRRRKTDFANISAFEFNKCLHKSIRLVIIFDIMFKPKSLVQPTMLSNIYAQ